MVLCFLKDYFIPMSTQVVISLCKCAGRPIHCGTILDLKAIILKYISVMHYIIIGGRDFHISLLIVTKNTH